MNSHGMGLLAQILLRRILVCAIPFAVLLLLARFQTGQGGDLWPGNPLLVRGFLTVSLVVGLGGGLLAWWNRRPPVLVQMNLFERDSARAQPVSRVGAAPGSLDKTFSDSILIEKAREFHNASARGVSDLKVQCAGIDPFFKVALAKEIVCLAGRAGVSEKAALLALVAQFEN